ncbi:MAG TPA: sigma-70 family RNA polymerase sigma factor [Capsulimonadaceae bacterium]|nr:sigma-70 family RNA polymerase sigma factor [Capsulimonadaceae bacterium]
MRKTTTDRELVERVLGGDAHALTVLVQRYEKMVYAVALQSVHNFADAQDIAQESFLQAYLHLSSLRDRSRFAPWLRQIAVNQCRLLLREPGRSNIPLEAVPAEPRKNVDFDLRLSLERGLDVLSEANRLTFVLYSLHTYSQKEIAEFLDVPLTTVASRIRNTKAQLRRELSVLGAGLFADRQITTTAVEMVTRFVEAVKANDIGLVRAVLAEHPRLIGEKFLDYVPENRLLYIDSRHVEAAPDHDFTVTPLHFAARYGHAALAQVLIENGAAADAKAWDDNHQWTTPVVLAAWEGGAEVLRVLLENGADPNLILEDGIGENGSAALYTAAWHGKMDRCRLLIAHGARVGARAAVMLGVAGDVDRMLGSDPSLARARDKRGMSLMDYAAQFGQGEVADLLSARGSSINLEQAAGLGLLAEVRRMLEADPARVDPTDGSRTPLMAAAHGGHIQVMRYLLDQGANVNLGEAELTHTILPIHVAVAAAVPVLVAAGADVNIPYRGYTPLRRAMENGDLELAEVLCSYGAREDS